MIELRASQTDLLARVRHAFTETRNVLMVAPTGFGKTVVFCYLASAVRSRDKRVYILCHRDELVDQISRTLSEFNVPHGFIAAGRSDAPSPVMVCSVFTLDHRIESYEAPHLAIIDEAHHAAAGSTWDRVLDHWQGAYRLGVTATPIRLDGRDLSGRFDRLVEGPSVGDLIDTGQLCQYRMYAPPVVLGKLRKRMGDYVKSDLAVAMDKGTVTGDAVAHYTRLAAGKRAVVFCVSLEHAEHTRDAFRAAGYIAERIDGQLDRVARRAMVEKFSRGEIQVLTSCEIVSEGFDLPAIECAVLLRPTASLGLYLQQVGRSLRPSPGKPYALILDHAGNAGTHGLPDDERIWDLESDSTRKRGEKRPVFTVRTCGECHAANRAGTMVCAYCGWKFPVEARSVKVASGELEEVKIDRTKILMRQEVGMAEDLKALVEIEKRRGYKPGWALHVWQSRSSSRAA